MVTPRGPLLHGIDLQGRVLCLHAFSSDCSTMMVQIIDVGPLNLLLFPRVNYFINSIS
jgi:hypothetical protein